MAPLTLVMASRNPGKIRELEAILQDSGVNSSAWRIFPSSPKSRKRAPPLRRMPPPRPWRWPGSPDTPPWPTTRASWWTPLVAPPGSSRPATPRPGPARPPTDADNWGKLLDELQTSPGANGGPASCANSPWPGPDGRLLRARGECAGVIAFEPQGDTGFGYDPVFWVPEYAATMAQLGPEIKNKISHRARALAAFKTLLRSWLKEQETGGSGSVTTNLA